MSEQEGPDGRPVSGSGQEPERGWLKLLQTAVLTVAAMWMGYRSLTRMGVRNPTPYLLLLLFSVIALRLISSALGGKEQVSTEERPLVSLVHRLWIRLPEGWTLERLVDFVHAALQRGAPAEEIVSELRSAGFLEDDVHVAIARTIGGLVRARTPDPRTEPSRWKDPIAWMSYRRALRNPGFAAALVPLASPAEDRE